MVIIEVETTLRSGGYRCKTSPYDTGMLLFEDDVIFGFVALFESATELLDQWRDKQTLFIQRTSGILRRASMKSWNCYAIFLCSGVADEELKSVLTEVEEDLALTRKVVADGVTTLRDVQRALLPILPIQNHAVPAAAMTLDLAARLETWWPQAIRALEGDATAAELIEILWDGQ